MGPNVFQSLDESLLNQNRWTKSQVYKNRAETLALSSAPHRAVPFPASHSTVPHPFPAPHHAAPPSPQPRTAPPSPQACTAPRPLPNPAQRLSPQPTAPHRSLFLLRHGSSEGGMESATSASPGFGGGGGRSTAPIYVEVVPSCWLVVVGGDDDDQ